MQLYVLPPFFALFFSIFRPLFNLYFQEFGLQRAEGMLGQSVVLSLEEKDQISVFAYHGNIRDGGWHYTHFTGYLLF